MDSKTETKRAKKLASLHPTPKTFDEKYQENEVRQQKIRDRQPKYVALRTSVNLSIAALVLTIIIGDLTSFMYFGVISGVSFLFLAALLWFGFVGWQFMRISDFFSQQNYSAAPFFFAYSMSVIPLFVSVYSAIKLTVPIIAVYLLLVILNIGLILFLTRVITAAKLSGGRKMTILISTVLAAIAFAIIFAIV